jgi:titin
MHARTTQDRAPLAARAAPLVCAALSAALLTSCYQPDLGGGTLLCASQSRCPEGFHCVPDNTCWKNGTDPTAPGAPTGLTAKPDGPGALVLTWQAPLSDGGSLITGFTVTESPGGLVQTTSGLEYARFTGLEAGSAHTFSVAASNAVGPGPAAAAGSVLVASAPGLPLSVAATKGNAAAEVSWAAPASDGGDPVLDYFVASSPAGASAVVSGALSVRLFLLTNGTPYTFTVKARNRVGSGPASAPSAAVTPGP